VSVTFSEAIWRRSSSTVRSLPKRVLTPLCPAGLQIRATPETVGEQIVAAPIALTYNHGEKLKPVPVQASN